MRPALLLALALPGCAALTWGAASRVTEATADGITIRYDRLILDPADLAPAAIAHCLRQGRATEWLPPGRAGGFETLRAACPPPEREPPLAAAAPRPAPTPTRRGTAPRPAPARAPAPRSPDPTTPEPG